MAAPTVRSVCVLDLPAYVTEDFLYDFFGQVGTGTIQDIKLVGYQLDPRCKSSSYAFITFDSHNTASCAIRDLNYSKLDGNEIRIIWSDPETDRIRKSMTNLLVITNLDPSVQAFDLHRIFSEWGDVIYTEIARGPTTNKSLEYGFVQFRTTEDAIRGLEEMRGIMIQGRPIEVWFYQKQ